MWAECVTRWKGYDAPMLAWCEGRLDLVRRLPDTFFLDPTAHWPLRSSPDEQALMAALEADLKRTRAEPAATKGTAE